MSTMDLIKNKSSKNQSNFSVVPSSTENYQTENAVNMHRINEFEKHNKNKLKKE